MFFYRKRGQSDEVYIRDPNRLIISTRDHHRGISLPWTGICMEEPYLVMSQKLVVLGHVGCTGPRAQWCYWMTLRNINIRSPSTDCPPWHFMQIIHKMSLNRFIFHCLIPWYHVWVGSCCKYSQAALNVSHSTAAILDLLYELSSYYNYGWTIHLVTNWK